MEKRLAFKFYSSYYDVAQELNDNERLAFYDALMKRQFLGLETELKGMAKFAYISQKHSIDKQIEGWESKMKTSLNQQIKGSYEGGAQGGIKGGAQGGIKGGIKDPSQQEKEEVQEKEKEEVQEKEEEQEKEKRIETEVEKNESVVVPTQTSKIKSFKVFTKDDFKNSISENSNGFTKEMLNKFYQYWTEPSPSGKMRFQLEKTWETSRRLNNWRSREISTNPLEANTTIKRKKL